MTDKYGKKPKAGMSVKYSIRYSPRVKETHVFPIIIGIDGKLAVRNNQGVIIPLRAFKKVKDIEFINEKDR